MNKNLNAKQITSKVIFFFLLIGVFNAYAQEKYLEIFLEDKTSTKPIKNVHLVKDDKTNTLFAFIEETKTTYGYIYDEAKNISNKLVSKGLKRKYKEIIGQAIDGKKIRLLQRNNRGNKFASILYDFENNITTESEYDIDMKKHSFLQSYNHENTSYVFTINQFSGIIKKWSFKIDGSYEVEDLNFKDSYKEQNITPINFHDLILEEEGLKSIYSITKIENKLPNSLEIACQQNKMYEYEGGFIWTFDGEKDRTVLLDFSLPDLTPKISIINKSKPKDNSKNYKSNSFIIDNVIAQIISNSNMLNIDFKDKTTFNIIKSYHFGKKDSINIKNDDVVQEGSVYSFGNARKLKKTSKFLRKISSDKNGLSIYKTEDGYRTTIGGVRKQYNGGGAMMMPGGGFGGMPIGQIGGGINTTFNPASFAYGSYSTTGSTRIESIFDEGFIHIPRELKDNVFDKIDALKKNNTTVCDDVFLIDNTVLYGNYYPKLKKYRFIKFK